MEDKVQLPGSEDWPSLYRNWRSSRLGMITDRIESRLIFRLTGELTGKKVLDVGCGDGTFALQAADLGAEVHAVDASSRNIIAARHNATMRGRHVACQAAKAQALPFSNGAFDVVVAVTVLCFMADAESALHEMARVIRPGGRLVIGELGRWSLWAMQRRLRGYLGSTIWRRTFFRTPAELHRLADGVGLKVNAIRGAVYYPPIGFVAHFMAPLDHRIDRFTKIGASFLALDATKPEETHV